MAKLKNKVAVVTGGSSGIGLATAKKFVEEGAYVFITGRRQSELDKAVKEIGRNVTAIQGDISRLEDLDRLYTIIKAQKGSLDIIVASAGFVEIMYTPQVSSDHFDKTFDVNARGTFFTVQKALPLLNDKASIVLVGSCVYLKGFPQYVTYGATKAAIRYFTKAWAAELKDRGIRVNTLSPGAVDTPIVDGQFKTAEEAAAAKAMFAQFTPLGRIGKPEELAAAALFLASEDSSYITGVDLVADGGMTQL
ncbi:oxidoreductase [Niastella yeongjuensis]|uniref:Oxidoreductase n=1 Tax=Niastella yeongjuensis TaxID=354355 RepID=A0A1V9E102_9BACT|nr:glucose 1-dehydrogenase [Niastella yeongjuensis]OQP39796.1 oxidoreductase [Niastella yeongjuensis]SEO05732.1 NAD(P)-dependent dehydrogenase, short-chain alcohol dehydrogenase family [Niastella yeongjuensis]